MLKTSWCSYCYLELFPLLGPGGLKEASLRKTYAGNAMIWVRCALSTMHNFLKYSPISDWKFMGE